VSRISATVAVVCALAFTGSLLASDLPMPVRTWVAENIPGGRSLVDLPPDPEAEVAALAEWMNLTPEGAELFAAAQPRVVDDLDEICGAPDDDGDAVTLGCYHGFDRIYILRGRGLTGDAMMVTTAAHELLHAAYARMDAAERSLLAELVAAETARIEPGARVLAQIDVSVGENEANRANEQFAYLGSQVVLPGGFDPALEDIYARWFVDREALAAAAP
jgi:hypothetical protein